MIEGVHEEGTPNVLADETRHPRERLSRAFERAVCAEQAPPDGERYNRRGHQHDGGGVGRRTLAISRRVTTVRRPSSRAPLRGSSIVVDRLECRVASAERQVTLHARPRRMHPCLGRRSVPKRRPDRPFEGANVSRGDKQAVRAVRDELARAPRRPWPRPALRGPWPRARRSGCPRCPRSARTRRAPGAPPGHRRGGRAGAPAPRHRAVRPVPGASARVLPPRYREQDARPQSGRDIDQQVESLDRFQPPDRADDGRGLVDAQFGPHPRPRGLVTPIRTGIDAVQQRPDARRVGPVRSASRESAPRRQSPAGSTGGGVNRRSSSPAP